MRSPYILVLFLATLGCATTDPSAEGMPPAPMLETAPSSTAWSARQTSSDLLFAQSDTIAHEWMDGGGRRMQVAFRVSYATPADKEQRTDAQVQVNWHLAAEAARSICEGADLTNEPGTVVCEEQLRSVLTSVLFPRVNNEAGACVDRVIWKRLIWD